MQNNEITREPGTEAIMHLPHTKQPKCPKAAPRQCGAAGIVRYWLAAFAGSALVLIIATTVVV
jgi:hypothetical protein